MKAPVPPVVLWVWKRACEVEEAMQSHPSLVLLLKVLLVICRILLWLADHLWR